MKEKLNNYDKKPRENQRVRIWTVLHDENGVVKQDGVTCTVSEKAVYHDGYFWTDGIAVMPIAWRRRKLKDLWQRR